MDALNSTRTILVESSWGYKDPKTGKFNGMIGQLQSDEAQISETCMFFTTDRVPYVDYIAQTSTTFCRFIFRRPSLTYTTNIYTLPLSTTVWICSILLVLLSACVIYITYRRSVYRNSMQYADAMKVSDVILAIIATVCQTGSQLHPKRISGRICTVILFKTIIFN